MSYSLTGQGPVTCSYGDELGLLYFVQGRTVTIVNLPGDRVSSVDLLFEPERFVAAGARLFAVGLDGWACLVGETLEEQRLAFGPHRILGGAPRAVTGVPDFNGLELPFRELEAHWGQPVTACLYRGELMIAYREGTALTTCGGRLSRAPYIQPTPSSRFYIHPHKPLIILTLPGGFVFSVDHGLGWHACATGEHPVYVQERVWAARDGVIVRES